MLELRGGTRLETYDLAVIGGGLTGTAVARDAAGRGLSVFLAEANDLGEGASSATGGVVGGPSDGFHPFALRRLRADAAERDILLRIAPHLVQPVRFLIPSANGLGAWRQRLGTAANDRLAGPRPARSERVDLTAGHDRGLLRGDLHFAWAVSDAIADDSRLAVLNAVDARNRGASIHPHVRCIVAEREGERWHLSLESSGGGDPFAVAARILVNATGAAVGAVNDHVIHTGRHLPLRMVKRAYLVVRRDLGDAGAHALPSPGGAMVNVVPMTGGLVLIGPRTVPYDGDPAAVAVERDDVAWLFGAVNPHLDAPLVEADIVSGMAAAWAEPTVTRSRSWAIDVDAPPRQAPLVSVIGATLATHRRAAEAAVSAVAGRSSTPGPGWTATAPLPGGAFPAGGVAEIARALAAAYRFISASDVMRLARAYGTRAQEILTGSRVAADLGRRFGRDLTEVEVNYLRREEWAETAADILWRRSKLGLRVTAAEAAELDSWMKRHRIAPPGPVMP